jgi:hypothetical protein
MAGGIAKKLFSRVGYASAMLQHIQNVFVDVNVPQGARGYAEA